MIKSYPYKFKTALGHNVVVSTIERGRYEFKVTKADGTKAEFLWFDNTYKGDEVWEHVKLGRLSDLERDVLQQFWAEQESLI